MHTFFDYVCLSVTAGGNEKIKFEANIWDEFDDVEKMFNKSEPAK